MSKPPLGPNETYVRRYWSVLGCSWRGHYTKRDGKLVRCGHKHRTEAAAKRCRDKMRKTKPGNCQDYRAVEIHLVKRAR